MSHNLCVAEIDLEATFPRSLPAFSSQQVAFQGKFPKGLIPSIKMFFFYSLSELRKIMYLSLLSRHRPRHWEPGNRAEKFMAVVSSCQTEGCQ